MQEVLEQLEDPPSYSSVRAMMGIESKGNLRHEQDGAKYVYLPTVAVEKAAASALRNLVRTFFEGSSQQAIAALLELPDAKLTDSELEKLTELIERTGRGAVSHVPVRRAAD